MTLLALLVCTILGGEPELTREAFEDVRMVVVYDNSKDCLDMIPVLKKVREQGYDVVYADARKQANKELLTKFDIKQLPFYIMYRGHEATETAYGKYSDKSLAKWIGRVQKGLPIPTTQAETYTPSDSQKELTQEDRSYLRYRMTPGTCGMLGCRAHGGGMILERVSPGEE